jgi:hypothetical protein
MRRIVRLLAVGLMVAITPATAAASGGFDNLRFEREYYVPGEEARGSTLFWVEVATVADREPYYAYLLPAGMRFEPPVIPDAAILLGALEIDLLPEGEANPARASLDFRVPKVAPGGYQVVLCNRPCRDDMVGDLIGGSLNVAASSEEARLLNFGAKLERRIDRRLFNHLEGVWTDINSLRQEMSTLDARVSGVAIQARRGETVDADLISRMDRAETELVSMERRITDLADRPSWPSSPLHWIVLASGWLAALAVASLWVRNALRAEHPSPLEEAAVDLDELTPQRLDESAGEWWARTGPAPAVTAASRRAMSLADNGWRRPDA